MPRKRQQTPRRRRHRVDPDRLLAAVADGVPYDVRASRQHDEHADLLYALVRGRGFFFAVKGRWSAEEEAVALEAWEAVRKPLLAEHARRQPDTRPWAWWRFDEHLSAEEARDSLRWSPEVAAS